MHWLHRLQQRLSLTKNEALALIALSGLFIIGILARHVQQRAVPVSAGAYDELDRLFFERSARADSAAALFDAPDAQGRLTGASGREARGNRVTAPGDRAHARTAKADDEAVRIDINRASAEALEALPRVGPKTAERILAFRATYGPFHAVEDLQQIRGIGPKTLELLRPHVYVSRSGEAVDTLKPFVDP